MQLRMCSSDSSQLRGDQRGRSAFLVGLLVLKFWMVYYGILGFLLMAVHSGSPSLGSSPNARGGFREPVYLVSSGDEVGSHQAYTRIDGSSRYSSVNSSSNAGSSCSLTSACFARRTSSVACRFAKFCFVHMSSLDVADTQVLIFFSLDPLTVWHHRVLLHRIAGARWMCLTPDLNVEEVDLDYEDDFRLLGRNERFPGNIPIGDTFAHDPIDKASMIRFKRQAKQLANILGQGDAEPVVAKMWIVSDVTSAHFGQDVDDDVVEAADTGAFLGDEGVALFQDLVVHISRITVEDKKSFVERRGAEQGDSRLIGLHLDPAGRQHIEFRDALPLMKAVAKPHFKFEGPAATGDTLQSVGDSCSTMPVYHTEWTRLSGINVNSPQCWEHRFICECIRLGVCIDQLDFTNLCMAENMIRRMLQIETAVERCPSRPDFTGLDVIEGNMVIELVPYVFRSFGSLCLTGNKKGIRPSNKSELLAKKLVMHNALDAEKGKDETKKGEGHGQGSRLGHG